MVFVFLFLYLAIGVTGLLGLACIGYAAFSLTVPRFDKGFRFMLFITGIASLMLCWWLIQKQL